MVIDVYIPKKLVASACYDKQHVCAYEGRSKSFASRYVRQKNCLKFIYQ